MIEHIPVECHDYNYEGLLMKHGLEKLSTRRFIIMSKTISEIADDPERKDTTALECDDIKT